MHATASASPRTKPLFWVALFVLFVVMIGVIWRLARAGQELIAPQPGKVLVVASIYPLADVAKRVGGDAVQVETMTPTGVEPHEYEPTLRRQTVLYQAKLLLLNGLGVDAWGDRLRADLEAKGVKVVRMADLVAPSSTDPHIWLDPVNVMREAELIAEQLTALDPAHAADYTARKDAYLSDLTNLDAQFRAGLITCRQQTFVTAHDAFQYLAHRYRLTSRPILGISPEDDPSPQVLAELTDLAKRTGMTHIFFESSVNPRLARTLAKEVGAETLVLYPIETLTDEDVRAGRTYLNFMQENLRNLRTALHCT